MTVFGGQTKFLITLEIAYKTISRVYKIKKMEKFLPSLDQSVLKTLNLSLYQ